MNVQLYFIGSCIIDNSIQRREGEEVMERK